MNTKGKQCIQYTDKRDGNKRYYALKVIDRTGTPTVTFMVSTLPFSALLASLFYIHFFAGIIVLLRVVPDRNKVKHYKVELFVQCFSCRLILDL